jgi:hypothetical protein
MGGVERGLLEAQIHFDKLLVAIPQWLALTLLALAAAMVVLGRHGQRVLSGALLVAGVVMVAHFVVAPRFPGAPWPGMLMIVGGTTAFACGLIWVGWATAVALAAVFGLAGGLATQHLAHLPFWWFAPVFALLGFFTGLASHRPLSVVLPPLAASLSLTVALSRLLGPHFAGATVPQLAELPYAFAVLVLTTLLFLAQARARDRWSKRRLAGRASLTSDAGIKKRLEQDRKKFGAHLGDFRS